MILIHVIRVKASIGIEIVKEAMSSIRVFHVCDYKIYNLFLQIPILIKYEMIL